MRVGQIEWTDEAIATLTKCWDDGMLSREIGERLGITKNAVIAKAKRLGLKSRRVASPRKAEQQRVPKCPWPIGTPGVVGFRFCDRKPAPGKVYCADHSERAYRKPADIDITQTGAYSRQWDR